MDGELPASLHLTRDFPSYPRAGTDTLPTWVLMKHVLQQWNPCGGCGRELYCLCEVCCPRCAAQWQSLWSPQWPRACHAYLLFTVWPVFRHYYRLYLWSLLCQCVRSSCSLLGLRLHMYFCLSAMEALLGPYLSSVDAECCSLIFGSKNREQSN